MTSSNLISRRAFNFYANFILMENQLSVVYGALQAAYVKLAVVLRNSSGGGKSTVTENKFGDIQLDTDITCEHIIIEELKKSGVVAFALSEETPEPIKVGEATAPFIVTFDPLDGSSIIGPNWAVGTIAGVWRNTGEKILIGQFGRDQVGASCCLYGSRTTALFYNSSTDAVDELTYFDTTNSWQLTKQNIQIRSKTNVFAPGNLRAVTDHAQYKSLVDYWISQGYTLRYTGGLVPDVYQFFIKEQGILTNIASPKNPAKLRYLYEVAPLALLVEKAGGQSFDGTSSVLDAEVTSYIQKSSIVVGSAEEVQRVREALKQT